MAADQTAAEPATAQPMAADQTAAEPATLPPMAADQTAAEPPTLHPPPAGALPAPQRAVGVAAPPPAAMLRAQARARVPLGSRLPMWVAALARLPAAPPARSRRGRPPGVPDHRRRVPRVVLRRTEGLTWLAALLVLSAVVTFVVRAVPAVGGSVLTVPRTPTTPTTSAIDPVPGPGSACIFDSCATPPPVGPPTRVRIRSINVDSTLEDLALNTQHELNAPADFNKAGWYANGVIPGDPGPAVIAGHVNSYRGPAVFYRLHELRAGALVEVLRGGVWLSFQVTVIAEYPKDKFPAKTLYDPTPDAELRVITCGGDFDRVHRRYYDNIVVSAVRA